MSFIGSIIDGAIKLFLRIWPSREEQQEEKIIKESDRNNEIIDEDVARAKRDNAADKLRARGKQSGP